MKSASNVFKEYIQKKRLNLLIKTFFLHLTILDLKILLIHFFLKHPYHIYIDFED